MALAAFLVCARCPLPHTHTFNGHKLLARCISRWKTKAVCALVYNRQLAESRRAESAQVAFVAFQGRDLVVGDGKHIDRISG